MTSSTGESRSARIASLGHRGPASWTGAPPTGGTWMRPCTWLVAGLLAASGGSTVIEAQSESRQESRPHQATAEFFLGSAWSLPLPLVIRLPGESVALRARYATRPWADAPYYAYRVGGGSRGHAAEAELVHHKLYLTNPRPPIEHFEVTHGYNLALGNLVIPTAGWQVRLGVGLVIAHAEGRVAGRVVGQRAGRVRTFLGSGYHVAGVTTQLAFGRRYPLGPGATALTVAPEAKLTAAFARVPLEEGSIRVPNVAVHALAGLGVRHRW